MPRHRSNANYHSLSDPAALIPAGTVLRWPSEAALGGWYTEAECEAAVAAIRSSMDWRVGFTARDEVAELEREFAAYLGVNETVALNGGATALDLVLRVLDLQPDDEVLSPAINFHGTHLAMLGTPAKLILCESDEATLNADPLDLSHRITPRTRALVVTHMNGLPASIDRILEVAQHAPRRPKVIFDAARALGAMYHNRMLGKDGWATVFSLQSKKQLTALGEGGIVATDDAELARRLRRMRSFGDGLEWGSNFKMTKPQAAVARIQLQRVEEMTSVRLRAAEIRKLILHRIPGVLLPSVSCDSRDAYYLNTIILPPRWKREQRDRLIARLAITHGIGCVVANPPTYQYNNWIRRRVRQRVQRSEELASRIICPSFHPLMTDDEHREIAETVVHSVSEFS